MLLVPSDVAAAAAVAEEEEDEAIDDAVDDDAEEEEEEEEEEDDEEEEDEAAANIILRWDKPGEAVDIGDGWALVGGPDEVLDEAPLLLWLLLLWLLLLLPQALFTPFPFADISKLSLSGEFKQVWIKALPASDIIIGCNFLVANV